MQKTPENLSIKLPLEPIPFMIKKLSLIFIASFTLIAAVAQPKTEKKYPSLLWEISGNGIKKSSYLIGTMHVSSKIAFNLPDSFYIAIRNAQVVALESNPETWQEDMSKYDLGEKDEYGYGSAYSAYLSVPNDYLTIRTLKYFKYDTKIERSLYSNPSTINNLLYRSYGNESSDFEEDTYLDMYIFQCGKKWGKIVTGVEDYGESMKLMAEAYRDGAKDKNRKERSYGDLDEAYSADKLQEAYRTGNLDLLDSINKFNSVSDAFDEKFLYKRNEIQARSIDSILRSGSSLFVGVGAAHLPGERGVIEMLRAKGYRLRPVKMGERASREKDQVDKIRVPVTFRTETGEDGFFKVDVPGKFFKVGEDPVLNQHQYADMSNGSYYMVTRVMTNAWMWNHSVEEVYRTIDSLLYENIPGKIITKTLITKNGYKGFDITNRTRRGDLQRYNIFITPFEILFFKMSGNGEYVKVGTEASKFFGSIQLKEYKHLPGVPATPWKKYSPSYGGFFVDLPHEPFTGNDGNWIYDAADQTTGANYRVIRTDIHNYQFVEEDSFDLGLLEESFGSSEFIDSQLWRKQIIFKGYPALDCKYRDINGQFYMTRFIIQGPHYYTLVAHGKQELPVMTTFFNSFSLKPFNYRTAKQQTDTTLYFSVRSPVYPDDKRIKLEIPRFNYASEEAEEISEQDILDGGVYRSKVIHNDSTGEKIFVSFYRSPRYHYLKDSSQLEGSDYSFSENDSLSITRFSKKTVLPNKIKTVETIMSDNGSSRALWTKIFYRDGVGFLLATQIDTLSQPSSFLQHFFETFTPADTLKGVNLLVKKSPQFFDDLESKDTVRRKRAISYVNEIELDSADFPRLKNALAGLDWKEKKYLVIKKAFINKLGNIKTRESADYLKSLYYSLDDTVAIQYYVLENLLQHQTTYAFGIFKDIISTEPPVLDVSTGGYTDNVYNEDLQTYFTRFFDNGNFFDELSDSLELTKAILPGLLPLLNLDDYKTQVMSLLGQMVDSNLLVPKDYDIYFSKFLIEAKQELKKQSIAEKKKSIEKAEEDKVEKKPSYSYYGSAETDAGNDDLSLYATLLLPYWDSHAAVKPLITQMLRSNDKKLKYNTLLLLLKNNKPFPDSLLRYFGGLDEYRYRLYSDLKEMKQEAKFPGLYNNHHDLGRSSLAGSGSYIQPDSVVYIDRLKTGYAGKNGYIYFYKYKPKKDDLTWKLAAVGLVPEDPKQFEFDGAGANPSSKVDIPSSNGKQFYFTHYSDTKLKETEPVMEQLTKMLRKMVYSRRNSAKIFYAEENERTNMPHLYQD